MRRMRWGPIAREEAALLLRARSARWLFGLLIFVCVGGGYLYPVVGAEPHTTARFTSFLTGWLTTLVPLIGLLVGYNAICSDRASGSLLLTLSMPYSRRDLVAGKLFGRMGLFAATIVGGLLAAGVLVVYPYGALVVNPFLGFLALTVGFGLLYTALGIAISMAVSTKQRATVLAFGVFFLFVLVWDVLEMAVTFALVRVGFIDGELPGIVAFLFAAEPGSVYGRLIAGFVDPAGSVSGTWYLNEWTALVLFCLWIVCPLGLAFWRFSECDL